MCQLGNLVKIVKVDKKDALTAYRAWSTDLNSLYQYRVKTKWRHGKVVRAHAEPTKKNSAGLYCYKTPKARNERYSSKPVHGIIKVWGTVAIHDVGYRATHAEIVRITRGKKYVAELAVEA